MGRWEGGRSGLHEDMAWLRGLRVHPALVFVVVVWGCNFVAIKYAFEEWPVPAATLFRYLIMWPMMAALAWATGQQVRLAREERGTFWFAGFLGSGVYMVLFLEGMSRVGAAQGAVCLATVPLWVGLFAVLKGQERFRWSLLVGTVVAYVGVATVVLAGSGPRHWTPLGIGLVLASALVWAGSVVLMTPLVAGRPALGVFSATFPGAAVVLVPYGAGSLMAMDFGALTWVGWVAMAYLVFLAGTGAFVAYYTGLRDVGPTGAALSQYFVPIVAAGAAWGLRGEAMNWAQGAGILVAVGGVALARGWGMPRSAREEPS